MYAGTMALINAAPANYYAAFPYYFHAEENVLHGDPSIKINAHQKPDFAIEAPYVIINPSFVSVADNSFSVKAYFFNLGKATGDSVLLDIKRKYPDGSMVSLFSQRVKSIRYEDSVVLTVPVVASRDKGQNELIVTIDGDNKYDELSELNNTVSKTFFIYEDELRPVYPYDFSIVNKSGIKLVTSTANPITPLRQYAMEIDTTELFNSSFKHTQMINATGGIVEFEPGIPFMDSTVYYWRVAPVPASGEYHWNKSSFVYLPASGFGYNQSHLYQHLKSTVQRIFIDSFSRKWNYNTIYNTMMIRNAVYPYFSQDVDFSVSINGSIVTNSGCLDHAIIFTVIDPVTLKLLYNQAIPSTNGSGVYGGFMGSGAVGCGKLGVEYNFAFHYNTVAGRNAMAAFMNWIPNGYLVVARLVLDAPFDQTPFADTWKNDALVNGTNLYLSLKNAGFAALDSFNFPRTWAFEYKKNDDGFTPLWKFTQGLNDMLTLSNLVSSPDSIGYITSPAFGPANAWHSVKWRGNSVDAKAGDNPQVSVIGVTASGAETLLFTLNASQQDFDISAVNASSFPYIKLSMRNADSINYTPYQLRYWRVLYEPVPEGALAPNILYTFKDSMQLGEQVNFAMAFKNVSDASFADSIKINMSVTDAANVMHSLIIPPLKKH